MKRTRIYMIVVLLLAAIPLLKAQNREDDNRGSDDEIVTLLGNSNHIGGYGALSMKYFGIDNRDGIMFGARGGIIAGHSISFGITGTGFLTQPLYDNTIGDDAMIVGGYGGIYIEPIILPRFPVHISLPVTIGGGGIGYSVKHYDDNNWDHNWDDDYTDGRGFLLIEPGIEIEVNVMRYFRFAVGGTYKFTSDLDLRYKDTNTRIISSNALNGATVGITFKFGSF